MELFQSNTNLDHTLDHSYPSVVQPFSNAHIHDILVVIGLITICLILLILIIEFFVKVRQIYRTSELTTRWKKPSQRQRQYPSYQELSDIDNHPRPCLNYSCLPKFPCVKPTCRIVNPSPYYTQINERHINNSISRVLTPHHTSSCIRVHTVK